MTISSLAPELLSKIFVHGTEGSTDNGRSSTNKGLYFDALMRLYDKKLSTSPPSYADCAFGVAVSLVSREWREVSIATSQLWSTIMFTLGRDIERLYIWLGRSHQFQIDIDVRNDRNPTVSYARQKESLDIVMPILLSHRHRWRSFTLCSTNEELMRRALHTYLYPAEGALQLTSLALLYPTDEPEIPMLFTPTSLAGHTNLFRGKTPLLTHVSLCGVDIDWSHPTILYGLNRLRLANHEVNGEFPWSQFANILQQCPELHTMEMENSGPTSDGKRWPRDIITLQHLRRLSLVNLDPEYCGAIIDRWQMPSLRELELSFDEGYPARFIEEYLVGRHINALRNLRVLKLSHILCPSEFVEMLYVTLTSLTYLHLNLSNTSEYFLRRLAGSPSQSPAEALPNLKTLALVASTGRTNVVQRVVAVRRSNGYPLARLHISPEDNMNLDDMVWFKTRVEGFEWR